MLLTAWLCLVRWQDQQGCQPTNSLWFVSTWGMFTIYKKKSFAVLLWSTTGSGKLVRMMGAELKTTLDKDSFMHWDIEAFIDYYWITIWIAITVHNTSPSVTTFKFQINIRAGHQRWCSHYCQVNQLSLANLTVDVLVECWHLSNLEGVDISGAVVKTRASSPLWLKL